MSLHSTRARHAVIILAGAAALLLAPPATARAATPWLLTAPAGLQQSGGNGAALRAAASRGELETVQALLGQGVAVDDANDYGATPLILAAMNGHDEVVSALLEAGAEPERADDFYHRTALQWATLGGHEDVGATLFVAGVEDFDALFREAVGSGDVEQVAGLLRMQMPDKAVLDEALSRALATRNQELADLLVSHGAEPPAPTIVSVPADRLRLYEGRYIDEVGYELVIIADLQTRALMVRPPDARNPLRFVPVADSTFIAENAPGVFLRFVVRGGRVVSLSFTQGDVTRRMSKQ